jgi:hypothetical protein
MVLLHKAFTGLKLYQFRGDKTRVNGWGHVIPAPYQVRGKLQREPPVIARSDSDEAI